MNSDILFQMTSDGLSQELGTDRETALGYNEVFWAKYSVAKKWLDDFVEEKINQGARAEICQTSSDRTLLFRSAPGLGERRRVKATLLQREEADLLRMAMMSLYSTFRDLDMMKGRICGSSKGKGLESEKHSQERDRKGRGHARGAFGT